MKSFKSLSAIFAFLFITTFFIGCTKEKRVERTLYKKGGTWNITSANWEKVAQTDTGITISTGIESNVGSFSFDKDKEGFCEYTIGGVNYSSSIKWNVIDENIYINDQNNVWDLFDTKLITFEGRDPDKNRMVLEGNHTESDFMTSYQTTITGTFTLERN